MEGQRKSRGGAPKIEPAIAITRGRIDKLTVHEVSDYELNAIQAAAEQGSSEVASIVLNFSIGLLTLSVSL